MLNNKNISTRNDHILPRMSWKIRNLCYGFRLTGGFKGHYSKDIYNISLKNTVYKINDQKYVKIENQNKMIYLSTHHHAAYLFTIQEYKAGQIQGNETFIHIDQSAHPDNLYISYKDQPNLIDDINKHIMFYRRRDRVTGNHVLHEGSYLYALRSIFRKMSFKFVHEGKLPADHYCRQNFRPNKSIDHYSKHPINSNSVLSIDLDIFGICDDPQKVLEIIIKMSKNAKLVMLFTSPGYMKNKKMAGEYAEKIIESLLNL